MKLKTLKPPLATLPSRLKTAPSADSWRAGKTKTSERGYGWRWQKARERYLQAHPLCVMCEAENRVMAATVVDHKEPHRGDETLFWNEANWQSLCAPHHSSDKQRLERGGKERRRISVDGWPE